MRNEFAQKCLMAQEDPAVSAQRQREAIPKDVPEPQAMPDFMKAHLSQETSDYGGNGFDAGGNSFGDTDNIEHMEEVDYNRLRELGVDEMAMNAIKNLFG